MKQRKNGIFVGYARVSTQDQNMDLQRDALKGAECRKIFTDTASGANDARKGLTEAIEYLRKGDTLVIWKLDRLGRSLKQLIETVRMLNEQGIGLKSLQESIDTTTSGGKLSSIGPAGNGAEGKVDEAKTTLDD